MEKKLIINIRRFYFVVVSLLLILSVIQNPVHAASYTPLGKGVIYYTENYIQNPSLGNGKYGLPVPDVSPQVPSDSIDAAYFDLDNGYTVIKGDRYWYRKTASSPWYTNTLESAFSTSPNWQTTNVPTTNIDAVYYDTNRAMTVIKGDRYWYRTSNTDNWYTNTLQSTFYTSANAGTIAVPTSNIDTAYYDKNGVYTIIKGDTYWWRSSSTGNWTSGTLRDAFYTSPNAAGSLPPTYTISTAYFNLIDNSYTVMKGNTYWYRTNTNANWYTNSLYQAYQYVPNLLYGTQCSRYVDLTDKEINYFKDLGLNYVIIGFGPAAWYNLAPTKPNNPTSWNDPAYNFAVLDSWISKLEANNITVVLQLWGTPTWSSGQTSPDTNGCLNNRYINYDPYNAHPQNLNDYADFVQAVATRYNGQNVINQFNSSKLKVNIFSLWNEPNLSDFWSGGMNALPDYITMNNLAYDRIKQTGVRPDAQIWAGNLSGGWIGSHDYDFINYILTSVSPLKFDVFATHAYPANFNAPPRPVTAATFHPDNLETLFSMLDNRIEYKSKPVAITELGYRSNWENTMFGITGITIDDSTKADYLQQTLNIINEKNLNPLYQNRIIAVTNNVFYNPWRWWSTGLANYYNQTTKAVDFNEILPAYSVFKNFTLTHVIITPGDLNGDGKVDNSDYTIFVSNFGKTGSPGFIPADIIKDGKVDIFDYNVLVGNFNK